jgi:hypothetical protein
MKAQVSSSDPAPDEPRTLQVSTVRMAAAVAIVATPLALAACGLLDGSGSSDKAPVVIPSAATGSPTAPNSAAPAPPPQPSSVTVTKTHVQTQNRFIRVTKTLPPVTVRPAPVTLTRTQTQMVVSVLPLTTATVTRTAPGRTIIRTVTRTVAR